MLFLLVYRQNNNNNNKKKQTKKQKDLTNIQFQLDWPRNSIVIQRFNIVPSLCANPQIMICSELVSSTNKTDLHDRTEILLKVALKTINLNHLSSSYPRKYLLSAQ
jgi:ABC-type lipoprotein export system ATPase subunit